MMHMEGWKKVRLGELIRIINGFAFPSENFTNGEGAPLIRIRDLKHQTTEVNFTGKYQEHYVVSKGDLLIGMDGDFSVVTWKGDRALLNQRVCKLISNDNNVLNQDFLFFRIINEIRSIHNQTAATTVKHLSSNDINGIEVELPSKYEQTQIATILSTLDKAIEQTETIIAKQQRIKTGLMQDLLTKGIDEHGIIRTEATHEFKDSPLGRIPVEWEIVLLREISHISSGLTLGKNYEGRDTIELPYLRVANVQDGYLDLNEVKTITIPIRDIDRYRLEVGDVLMNEGGDFDKLGRGTVWQGQIETCLHQNHVFRVRPILEKLLPEYLETVSASQYGKTFFMLASKQSTNLASINSTQLKSFPIPLPTVSEQKKLNQMISRHKETYESLAGQLAKLKRMKTGLMHDLLTGTVRVN